MKAITNVLSFLVFIPLQLVALPLAAIGVAIVTYRQVLVSRRLGVSSTGIEIIGGRWTMHVFGLRHDPPTARLIKALPNASPVGLWLVLFPLWLKYKLCGRHFLYPRVPRPGDETIADLVVARTVYFDEMLERLAPEMEQLVVLGAGYDTRAYGTLKREGLRWFELDQIETQRVKTAALERAGVDARHVTFVTVDFRREDTFEQLLSAGYDPGKKTLFRWEGVTLYLSETEVRRTLGDVRSNAATGSALVADIYAQRFVEFASKGINRKTLEYTDEAISFGLPFETSHAEVFARFVTATGLRLGATQFLGTNHEKGPYQVVAELRV